ncbi:MAG TPA: M12 family metallo-peptidase [Solirubrobacteraceae bacterium]|nr:M12 family metallo-peptidase [Solirubrobacteraceae bacterium]
MRSLRSSPALGCLLLALLAPSAAAGETTAARSADAWDRVSRAVPPSLRSAVPTVEPVRFAAFRLDRRALDRVLRDAPDEASARSLVVAVPAPDGRLERFAVTRSAVMERGLARRHPSIRTYAGRGVTDRTATIRLSSTPLGLHAAVRSATATWYVDPRFRGDTTRYVSYHRRDLPKPPAYENFAQREPEEEHAYEQERRPPNAGGNGAPQRVGLRLYRLALTSDPAYAQNSGAADGLDPNAPDYLERLNERTTAAKVVLMNRVNQLYEADFNSRMLLIDATDRLNLNTAALATEPNGPCGADACFTASQISTCSSGLLTRNAFVTGMIAGARSFDIGHIALGQDGGGIAQLRVVGDTNKARGCTGLAKPIGDFFAVDYVAHEMGHQFGGNHTFNGMNGSCATPNRNLTGVAAVEPGSGSSVMAYAGICLTDDLQAHSDPYFSQFSIREMGDYIRSAQALRSSVQQVGLKGFDGTDSLVVRYAGRGSAPITRGTNYTAADVDAAIEGLLPEGGTVTVTGVNGAAFDDKGFQVTFGGTLAERPVELLDVRAEGADVVVGETVAGGETTRGGYRVARSKNRAPDVTAPAAFTIPLRTPFTLTAQGRDPDGDAITYLWEQDDPGPPAAGDLLWNPVRTTGPLFRMFGTAARYADPDDTYLSPSPGENLATTDPSRSFPDLAQVVADNTNALTGTCPPTDDQDAIVDCHSELLPMASWVGIDGTSTLHFQVTARDNAPGAGGVDQAETALTLAKGAGPFRVLDARTLPSDARSLAVLWDVARTDVLTGTPQVRISLSTDGGATFRRVLAETTANDGNEVLTLPAGLKTEAARVRVEAVGNVFYDVSHSDLAIDTTA